MVLDLILARFFSYPVIDSGKRVIISGVDKCSSVDTDYKKEKDVLFLSVGLTQRLDDTTINFQDRIKNFV